MSKIVQTYKMGDIEYKVLSATEYELGPIMSEFAHDGWTFSAHLASSGYNTPEGVNTWHHSVLLQRQSYEIFNRPSSE